MTKNLSKRIFTSLILSIILLVCLFLNKFSWLILVIIASIISFLEFNLLVKKICKKNETLKYFFINIICFFYLFFFIYSAYELYEYSLSFTIFILLICIFSDIGGYFIGKTIGGKKLTKISPNKTISGSIGSFCFSIIPIFIYNIYDIFVYSIMIDLFIYTLLVSLFCQFGDLLISYFKRKAKVKDTGSILPGHGGMLDRIDGILFGLPTFIVIDNFFL